MGSAPRLGLGLGHSRARYAVRLARALGLEAVLTAAAAFGFDTIFFRAADLFFVVTFTGSDCSRCSREAFRLGPVGDGRRRELRGR
jgi:hypothetical protein